jgi:hypothetical protein
MAGEKTAAQLQAEAAAAKAREDEAKRAEEERRAANASGWLQSLIPDFSFFNILIFAALAFGAYMLGKTEQGVALLEKGIALLPESWQPAASGLLNKIGIKTDIAAPLLRLADKDIAALRETLTSNGIASHVVATIAKDKESFSRFLKPIMDAHGGRATLEDLTPAAVVTGSVLDAMLKPENRASTIALIKASLPANAGISDKTLDALIAHGTGPDGKPTAQLRALFAAATDGRLEKLQNELNDAQGKFSLTKAVDALLNPQNRALIREIGTDTIAIAARERTPQLTPQVLNAALAFGDAIDKNPANAGANRPRALAVLHALTNLASGTDPKTAFQGVTADQLSGFFAVPGNQAAVGNLLRAVQPALASHWGNADHGIAEVLASKTDAANILRFARGDITWLESIGGTAADVLGLSITTRLSMAGGKIGENAADVAAFVSPPPAPPARPNAPRR